MRMTAPRLLLAALLTLLSLAAPAHAAERVLVLPLQPGEGMRYDGLGPALQNLMENVVLLNPAFEETYSLAHYHTLFASAGDLQAYMLGLRPPRFPLGAALREGTRFVLGGHVGEDLTAEIWMADLYTGGSFDIRLSLDMDSGLTCFRQGLIEFLDQHTHLPFPPVQAAKALAPETTSLDALKTYGRSYGSYQILSLAGDSTQLNLKQALRAVREAPRSYLAANMSGWQFDVAGQYGQGQKLLREALTIDPNGVDALDGMMRIALMTGGLDAATPWALRKAKARGEDIGPVLAQMHIQIGNSVWDLQNPSPAWSHFRKAQALCPEWEQPFLDLAEVKSSLDRHLEAQDILNTWLRRPTSEGPVAQLMNRVAYEARLEALEFKKSGDAAGERRCLEKALAELAKCPFPASREKWLCSFELARHFMDAGDPDQAAGMLLSLPQIDEATALRKDCALVYCRAAQGENPELTRGQTRLCLRTLAERMRVGDPVPPDVFEYLMKTCAKLGDQDMAASLERQEAALREATRRPG
jgi:tetratricopeptide (TPR) repeat protein